jgi:hypothetical protein
MSITVKVHDKRENRNPSEYDLTIPDDCSVIRFLALVTDGSESANELLVFDKSKALLAMDDILEHGDEITLTP